MRSRLRDDAANKRMQLTSAAWRVGAALAADPQRWAANNSQGERRLFQS